MKARSRLAAAVLAGAVLTMTVPAAAMAVEPAPAQTSSSATSDGKTQQVVALDDSGVFDQPGNGGTLQGYAEAGEIYDVSAIAPAISEGDDVSYLISVLGGKTGYLWASATLLPAGGLTFEQDLVVTDPTGKRDALSGFGGKLSFDDLTIRTFPARDGAEVRKATPGEEFKASEVLEGESNLFGSSFWVAVELQDGQYGWLRQEATDEAQAASTDGVAQPAPAGAATESASAPAPGDVEPAPPSSETATETTAPAATTASAAPAELVAEPAAAPAEATGMQKLLLLGGAGLAMIIAFMALRIRSLKRKALALPTRAERARDDEAAEDAKPAPVKESAPDTAEAAVEETPATVPAKAATHIEDINWDEG